MARLTTLDKIAVYGTAALTSTAGTLAVLQGADWYQLVSAQDALKIVGALNLGALLITSWIGSLKAAIAYIKAAEATGVYTI